MEEEKEKRRENNSTSEAIEIIKGHSDRYLYYQRLEKNLRVTRILTLLEDEAGKERAVGELGLSNEEWEELKSEALVEKGKRLRERSKEEVFAQYVIAQSVCIRDLLELGGQFKLKGDRMAAVNAVKVRSEIFDKIIKIGQDLGLIDKSEGIGRKGTEVNVGVVLSGLSDGELRGKVVKELGNLNTLVQEYGESDILEIKPGGIHRKLISKSGRKNPVNSNKVHSGFGVNRRK